MKNRIVNILLTYGLDALFIALILALAIFFNYFGVGGAYLFIYFTVLLVSILPLFNYIHGLINRSISPARYEDLFNRTIDAIMNINSFNEYLKNTFDMILALLKVQNGLLIFYYPETDEYNIFYQKHRRRKVIRNARIESDNAIFKAIGGPDDIIIISKLDPEIPSDAAILRDLEKFNGEAVIPIYFQEIFLGIIIIGARKKKLSAEDIGLLKIFASKIAILSINSFFFHELLKKKELEKEFELASKIHHRFLPDTNISWGKTEIRVHHRTDSLMSREFFDACTAGTPESDLRISAYRLHSDVTGTSIYMPGIQALLQSYARLGYSPVKTIRLLNENLHERELVEQEIAIICASLGRDGAFAWSNNGYPAPFIYRNSDRTLERLAQARRGILDSVTLESGDCLIICCETYAAALEGQAERAAETIGSNAGAPASRLLNTLVKAVAAKGGAEEKDKLFILIRMEAAG